VGLRLMIQLTPQMRILVGVEAVDFRKGIDGLARVCREVWWPTGTTPATPLQAHQLQRLIVAGDPRAADAAPVWRHVATG
jgi:hypothetical protein